MFALLYTNKLYNVHLRYSSENYGLPSYSLNLALFDFYLFTKIESAIELSKYEYTKPIL